MTGLRFVLGLAAAACAFGAEGVPAGGLTVHEWGTFTSVAGSNGAPVTWTVLAGTTDLPCFVNRLGPVAIKSGPATVRMETPVLYFYSPSRTTVSVHVDFPQGLITEWYPKTARSTFNQADWGPFEVIPGGTASLPASPGPSHYYAARETDAALLQVGDQHEKMIFYRGAGCPEVPLKPAFLPDGRLVLANTSDDPIPAAIVFVNHGGKMGYRVVRGLAKEQTVDLPTVSGAPEALRGELADTLVEAGLFPKEAQAMLATWRDSWFEEGTRIFYILPRRVVDEALPIHIQPEPRALARVFVGRVEVLPPATREELETALASTDTAALARYGRFLDAYLHEFDRVRLPLATIQYLDAKYRSANDDFLHPTCK